MSSGLTSRPSLSALRSVATAVWCRTTPRPGLQPEPVAKAGANGQVLTAASDWTNP